MDKTGQGGGYGEGNEPVGQVQTQLYYARWYVRETQAGGQSMREERQTMGMGGEVERLWDSVAYGRSSGSNVMSYVVLHHAVSAYTVDTPLDMAP